MSRKKFAGSSLDWALATMLVLVLWGRSLKKIRAAATPPAQ